MPNPLHRSERLSEALRKGEIRRGHTPHTEEREGERAADVVEQPVVLAEDEHTAPESEMISLSFISKLWAAIPGALKRFVGTGLAVGIGLSIPLGLWLFWGTGYVQDKLGVMVTTEDLTAQTEDIAADQGDLVERAVFTAMMAQDMKNDSIWRSERQLVKDTVLVPILKAIQKLDYNQKTMSKQQAQSGERIDELPALFDEKLERVLLENDPAPTHELVRQLMRKLDQVSTKQDELQEQVNRRTNKKTF